MQNTPIAPTMLIATRKYAGASWSPVAVRSACTISGVVPPNTAMAMLYAKPMPP